MKKRFKFVVIPIVALTAAFFAGPRPDFEGFDNEPLSLDVELAELDSYIASQEAKVLNIKPDNESEIVWADSIRQTEYAIVYLHGYSASKGEGEPIHRDLAKKYGCNLHLPRLFQHGLDDEDAFVELTPKGLVESAKQAIAVGKLLGEKVILMSTSTGSTLSIYLAANDSDVRALAMMAPNIELADPNSHLVNNPWGKELLRTIVGSDYRTWEAPEEARQYWTTKNRIEGLIALRELMDLTMTEETFKQINIPVRILAYYKNDEEQDQTVSVPMMETFMEKINTPESQKSLVKFANAGTHPLGSKYMNEHWKDVEDSIDEFLGMIIDQQ
ncbi:MAG: alpha/beta hydrolase [Bacteroidota bacterium]